MDGNDKPNHEAWNEETGGSLDRPRCTYSAKSAYFGHAEETFHRQYEGDYEGVVWNSQAFFHSKAHMHHRKKHYALRTVKKRDFIGVVDAHEAEGGGKVMRLPTGLRSWWSAGTKQRAGVGLLVQESFLNKST